MFSLHAAQGLLRGQTQKQTQLHVRARVSVLCLIGTGLQLHTRGLSSHERLVASSTVYWAHGNVLLARVAIH